MTCPICNGQLQERLTPPTTVGGCTLRTLHCEDCAYWLSTGDADQPMDPSLQGRIDRLTVRT